MSIVCVGIVKICSKASFPTLFSDEKSQKAHWAQTAVSYTCSIKSGWPTFRSGRGLLPFDKSLSSSNVSEGAVSF